MELNENKKFYDFDHVVSSIVKILDLDETEIEIEKEIYWSKMLIEKILEIHKKNKNFAMYLVWEVDMNYYAKFDKKLKKDIELWFVAVKASSENYKYLDKALKKNLDIAEEVIKSIVREWNNFTIIENFIETNFPKHNKKLWRFYENYLKRLDITLTDDLVKNINFICKNNNQAYQLLLSKKIININWKKININKKFINIFEESLDELILKQDDFELKTKEEKNKFFKDYLLDMSWLNSSQIDKDILFIFEGILDIYDKRLKKKLAKEKLDKKADDLNENKIIDEKQELEEIDINNEKDEEIDEFREKLDYFLPNYSYSNSWLWEYHINTNSGLSIKISESEKNNFSGIALSNFVKFYNILYKLWLDFIWNSYKEEFIWLLDYKNIWFDYLNWNWVDEEKVLEILNLLWKNIWLSGEQIMTGDSKSNNGFLPYETIWSAYSDFRKAKLSSKINDEHIDTNIVIWTVEKKLSDDWKINYSSWTFDLTKWK